MSQRAAIAIGRRIVGAHAPVYVIAEIGMNHNGDMQLAREMIRAAAKAGADAVKFQSFRTDRLVPPNAPDRAFRLSVQLSDAQHEWLRESCELEGVDFLSTPCDEEGVDLLVRIGAPALKIGSFEITHLPLLAHAARAGLPLLVSTGASTMAEIQTAVRTIHAARADAPLALLHCVSQYPADHAKINLRTMQTLRRRYRCPVGYSDHTLEPDIAALAVAAGACIIEKHFTLDHALPGPDQAISANPEQLAEMIRRVRVAQAALGRPRRAPLPQERSLAAVARRSVCARVAIPAGTLITRDQLDILRPAAGLPPAELERVVGARAKIDIAPGTPLTWNLLEQRSP